MAKQSAATAHLPSATHIQNRDLLLRLSFMHQAASYLHLAQAAGAPVTATAAVATEEEGRMTQGKVKAQVKAKEKGKGKPGSLDRLARTLGRGIKDIGLHNKAKLDVSFKRSLCKGCSAVLIPGTTSRVRVRSSRTHAHRLTQTCLACSTTRSIPAPPSGPPPTPSPTTTPEGEFPSASSASTTPAPAPPPTTTMTTTMATTTKQQRKCLRQCRPLPLSEREGVGHARFESESAGRENGSTVELI